MFTWRGDRPEASGVALAGRDWQTWSALGIWLLTLVVAVVDVHHVLGTSWMGSDFQPFALAVPDLVHHRALPEAYVYPPGLLVLGLPLLLLQHGRRAEDLGLALDIASLLIGFGLMARLTHRRFCDLRLATLALVLVLSAQVTYVLQLGNLTLVLLPAAVLFYLALDRDQPIAAGVVLGLSLVTKPMLLPLIVPLLLMRKWRATAVSLAIPVGLSALTLPFVDHPVSFLHATLSKVAGSGATAQTNSVNLAGIARLWHLGNGTAIGLRVIGAVATVAIAEQLWVTLRPGLVRCVWTTQVLLDGLLLCFSLTHSFYPLLLLPLAFLVLDRPRSASSALAILGLALSWMPFQIPGVAWAPTNRPIETIICLGMVAVLAAGAVAALEARRLQNDAVSASAAVLASAAVSASAAAPTPTLFLPPTPPVA